MSKTDDGRPPVSLKDRVQSLRLPDRSGGGGTSRLPWFLCILLLCTTAAFGWQSFNKSRDDGKPSSEGPPKTDGASADSGDIVLQAKGYIIPAHVIQVSPQVGGLILDLNVEEGRRVKKGETLAVLEDIEYRTKFNRADAKYRSAKESWELIKRSFPQEVKRSELDRDEAAAELARVQDQLDRAERLDIATQSREELNKLRNEKAMMSARAERRIQELTLTRLNEQKIKVAEEEMKAAQAERDETKWRLDNCIVKAPVPGTILTKKAEKHNLVNPVAFNVSASLCEMADLSDLEVDLSIQERDIATIEVGQKCHVMPEAYQSNKAFLKDKPRGYDGVVSRLMPIADRAKGAIPVRVKVKVAREEEGVYLKPDMGVIVSFKKPGS